MALPKYRQIINDIKGKIESGELVVGDNIGSTRDLCLRYEVSGTAINQATLVLESMGLIEGVAGVGRFVK